MKHFCSYIQIIAIALTISAGLAIGLGVGLGVGLQNTEYVYGKFVTESGLFWAP